MTVPAPTTRRLLPVVCAAIALTVSLAAGAPPTTTIGLFVPLNGPDAPEGIETQRGASMAIEEAGSAGRRFRLVSAASDVPWSAATGALVRLIYDHNAAAVIGALDARTAHLAEQVITRARGEAVFVTPWASEPALTRIQIPWFFSVVPDDRRQAAALAREAYGTRAARRVALWVGGGLDTSAGADAFAAEAPPGTITRFDATDPGARDRLITQLHGGAFDLLILYAPPRDAADLVGRLRGRGDRTPILGPIALAAPGFLDAGSVVDDVVLAAPARMPTGAADRFADRFRSRYGVPPTMLARLSHDAAAAIIEAVLGADTDQGDPLAAALSAGTVSGASGAVRFEARRGRETDIGMSIVKDGVLVPIGGLRAGASRRGTP